MASFRNLFRKAFDQSLVNFKKVINNMQNNLKTDKIVPASLSNNMVEIVSNEVFHKQYPPEEYCSLTGYIESFGISNTNYTCNTAKSPKAMTLPSHISLDKNNTDRNINRPTKRPPSPPAAEISSKENSGTQSRLTLKLHKCYKNEDQQGSYEKIQIPRNNSVPVAQAEKLSTFHSKKRRPATPPPPPPRNESLHVESGRLLNNGATPIVPPRPNQLTPPPTPPKPRKPTKPETQVNEIQQALKDLRQTGKSRA